MAAAGEPRTVAAIGPFARVRTKKSHQEPPCRRSLGLWALNQAGRVASAAGTKVDVAP